MVLRLSLPEQGENGSSKALPECCHTSDKPCPPSDLRTRARGVPIVLPAPAAFPYSSGVSASLGRGPSIGFRGNMPSRMAALYTKSATITAACFRSSACKRS